MNKETRVRWSVFPGGNVTEGTPGKQGTRGVKLGATEPLGQNSAWCLTKFHSLSFTCVQLHCLLMKNSSMKFTLKPPFHKYLRFVSLPMKSPHLPPIWPILLYLAVSVVGCNLFTACPCVTGWVGRLRGVQGSDLFLVHTRDKAYWDF